VACACPCAPWGEYLKRWGFTVQKPVQQALEQRPAAVRRWLQQEYPAIVKQAKIEGAEIYWGIRPVAIINPTRGGAMRRKAGRHK
jgi:hypothetical protein